MLMMMSVRDGLSQSNAVMQVKQIGNIPLTNRKLQTYKQ